MIKELKINNLAIIKDVNLDLEKNFTALTGETGAGKSIILDGLALITGSRANIEAIRKDEDKLSVEAVISLNDRQIEKIKELDYDIDIDDELIIHRQISLDGKSKISINDKRVTLSTLNNIMENIIDIVGQHENQYLLNKKFHLDLLDGFIKKDTFNLKEISDKIKKLNRAIDEKISQKEQISQKKDVYEFQIKEIDKLNLYENIDEELEKEYKLKFNSGRIKESILSSLFEFDENIFRALKRATKSIKQISDLSEDFSEIEERLEEVSDELQSIYSDILDKDIYEEENEDLDEINEKLSKINNLKMKYKMEISEIILYKEKIEKELESLDFSDEEIEKLKEEKQKYIDLYFKNANNLSELRKKTALTLEKKINLELKDLNMENAKFKVQFESKDQISENGIDDVEFLLRANIGQEYAKLSKIASGGEISRIMLALKIVFSEVDNISSLIFDEIDTGISGETVKMVAKKMKSLCKNIQIICVTHSPNIAAACEDQFLIYKEQENGKTLTKIKKLNYEQRILEIARIISGNNITDSLKEHVKEMINATN